MFGHRELGDEAARLLASSAAFPSLRQLVLCDCAVSPAGVAMLRASKRLPSLRTIETRG